MVRTIVFAGLLGFSTLAKAVPPDTNRIDIICCTHHFNRNGDHNGKNFGISYAYYFTPELSGMVTRYKNSELNGESSSGVGLEFTTEMSENVDFRLSAGFVNGYEKGTTAFILPTMVLYDHINISVIPMADGGMNLSFTAFWW